MKRYQGYDGAESGRKTASSAILVNGLRQLLFLAVLGFGSVLIQNATAGDAEFAIGVKLADMLRASRNVISSSQPLINNADVGDKNFTGEKFVRDAQVSYARRVGGPLVIDGLSARDKRLLNAQRQAMRQVVDEHQKEINRLGVGFKGFIPAIFARLVNEEFGLIAGQEARIRVTAPPDLVRNRKARPDVWEGNILETRFLTSDWPKGQPFTEEVEFEGRPAFRMLLPEYYRESCLACHGEPKGEMDITSYPKEGGKVGDLAGAISIVIFR